MATSKMSFSDFKNQFAVSLFDEYRVKLFLHDVAGGTPMDPELIKGWIEATCKDKSEEDRRKIVEATLETLPEVAEGKEARSWVGFKKDTNGHLYIEGRCVKAMLKEAANIIKDIAPNGGNQRGKNAGKDKGVSAFQSKVADRVFVVEDKVYFTRNGERLMQADEREERPVHAMTPQGPRSSLKRTDILRNVEVEFTVRRLSTSDVPEEALYACLVYAQSLGLGADRSQGRGTMKDIVLEKTKEAA